jgi:uncharacterized RmlC-like cupin family protein
MSECRLIRGGAGFRGKQGLNPDKTPVRAVLARTDPNEQESVVLLGDDSSP